MSPLFAVLAVAALGGDVPLPPVVVTANAAEVPSVAVGSASTRDGDDVRAAGPGLDLSEVLHSVPGVVANNRGNYAQDTQVSARGYGARATFGVRGIRLYVNGIPATAPDGQGQIAHVALAGVARIAVLRGPLTALYGNAAGAVIKLDGDPGDGAGRGDVGATLGRDFDRETLAWRGGFGIAIDGSYALLASRFATDGYRPHGAAKRETFDALARFTRGDWRIALTANVFDSPYAQDPLGLTAAQFRADPDGTADPAIVFDTRKTIAQRQAGAAFTRDEASGLGVHVAPYAGSRDVVQYLAVPVVAQQSPTSAGGVIDLTRDYAGVESRAWRRFAVGQGTLLLGLGANADALREDRRGYENFVGNVLGVRGALRRDEANRVDGVDLIGTFEWQPTERWRVTGGWRASRIDLRSDDAFIVPSNPDDSGRRRFRHDNPALGVSFAASPALTWHAAVARASEVPTLNELAYRSDGSSGFNTELRAARAWRREIGMRWQRGRGALNIAAFADDVRDELAVARSQGGRTSFRNIDESERRGIELEWTHDFSQHWQAALAYTRLEATLPDDTKVPGVPSSFGQATLAWTPTSAWRVAAEVRGADQVYADDTNAAAASGYVVGNLAATRRFTIGDDELRLDARLDNVADHRYAGSVIVNEANGRYFEPAAGRTWSLAVTWQWR